MYALGMLRVCEKGHNYLFETNGTCRASFGAIFILCEKEYLGIRTRLVYEE